MSDPITVSVDPTNPGQFFACCGLLELADRLWPGAEGCFTPNAREFRIACGGHSLPELLTALRNLEIEGYTVTDSDEEDEDSGDADDGNFEPLVLTSPVGYRVDWFSEINLKPWAGSMKPKPILTAMARSIDPSWTQPFMESVVATDPARERVGRNGKVTLTPGKPREPFYFDSRRGMNVIDRDVGFVPDALKKAYKRYTFAFPAVEALAPIGLQRGRPRPTKKPRVFDYFTWAWPVTPAILPVAVVGALGDPKAAGYRFKNAFRTGKKQHKAYMQAIPIPPGDES